MCSPSPPPAPDYTGAAQAQGTANLEAARTQGRMNNPNVNNPYGTQTVTWDGDTPTINQTLSPEQQRLYLQQVANQSGLGNLAGQGISSLQGLIGRDINLSGMPSAGSAYQAPGQLQVNAAPGALELASLGAMPEAYKASQNLPAMPGSYDATRNKVINAMMARSNDAINSQQKQVESDLVARGLMPGTKAYQRELDSIGRQRNDAMTQAELAGGNATEQAYGMDLSSRRQGQQEALDNATLGYNQAMGIRGARTGEQAQRFDQLLSGDAQRFDQLGRSSELSMRQQGQQNSQQNELRRNAIAELLMRRQTPLNEITALMSGSQVSNPFSVPGYAQNTNVAPPPLFGAAQANGQQANNIYNAQTGTRNANMSTAGTLGAAGMAMMMF